MLKHLSKLNKFFSPKGVQFGQILLYIISNLQHEVLVLLSEKNNGI